VPVVNSRTSRRSRRIAPRFLQLGLAVECEAPYAGPECVRRVLGLLDGVAVRDPGRERPRVRDRVEARATWLRRSPIPGGGAARRFAGGIRLDGVMMDACGKQARSSRYLALTTSTRARETASPAAYAEIPRICSWHVCRSRCLGVGRGRTRTRRKDLHSFKREPAKHFGASDADESAFERVAELAAASRSAGLQACPTFIRNAPLVPPSSSCPLRAAAVRTRRGQGGNEAVL